MATTTGHSIHILRHNPEIFTWPLNDALHHARMGNQGLTSQQAEKVENFIVNMPPDDMPKLEALIDQVIRGYSAQKAPDLMRMLEDIADGRRPLPALQNFPDSIGRNREMLNTPLYAWTVEDLLSTAEEAEDGDPNGTAAKAREFVELIPDDQKPALMRFLTDAVEEHQRELAQANRRMAETVLGYLEMAAKNGRIPNAYQ